MLSLLTLSLLNHEDFLAFKSNLATRFGKCILEVFFLLFAFNLRTKQKKFE